MKPEEVKIVFPVDVSTEEEAARLLVDVASYVDVVKVGLELIHNIGTPAAVNRGKQFGNQVFADVKLNDIPNTVAGAARGITRHGVNFYNVMACGGEKMVAAAVKASEDEAEKLGIPRPKVIAVTVLTSLEFKDLSDLCIKPNYAFVYGEPNHQQYIADIVLAWAKLAVNAGVDIILSSPFEAAAIHQQWPDIDIYCPGIRLPSSPPDDQKRTMTPGEAAKQGVKYLVIGRPIRNPESGKTRQQVVEEIRADIARAFGE